MLVKFKNKLERDGIKNTALALYDKFVPVRIPEYQTHFENFSGQVGIELGGPSQRFGATGYLDVYAAAGRIDNCNYTNENIWGVKYNSGQSFKFHPDKEPGRQYVCEAQDLSGIESGVYDFLLSSHCLEHIANPLKALYEWQRVLKPGGRLFLILPHRDCTFDKYRPITSLDHIISDYEHDVKEDDLTHLQEILELNLFQPDNIVKTKEEFEKIAHDNFQHRYLHHHVFDTCTAIQLVEYAGFAIEYAYALRPHDIVIIGRKPLNSDDAVDSLSSESLVKILNESPFKTDLTKAHTIRT
jgi:SAM-dependent methyltransferase